MAASVVYQRDGADITIVERRDDPIFRHGSSTLRGNFAPWHNSSRMVNTNAVYIQNID